MRKNDPFSNLEFTYEHGSQSKLVCKRPHVNLAMFWNRQVMQSSQWCEQKLLLEKEKSFLMGINPVVSQGPCEKIRDYFSYLTYSALWQDRQMSCCQWNVPLRDVFTERQFACSVWRRWTTRCCQNNILVRTTVHVYLIWYCMSLTSILSSQTDRVIWVL